MNNNFPRGIKTSLGRLRLPEFQVKGPVQVFQLASAFNKIFSHI
jgi:hypothetical protein